MERSNGITTTITPDVRVRPVSIQDTALAISYTYDGEGNVRSQNGLVYGYDGLDRLTSAQVPGAAGGVRIASYTYDKVGNRLSEAWDGGTPKSYGYSTGNYLASAGGTTYSYGKFRELRQKQASGTTTEYIYDGARRMVQVKVGGTEAARYVYDAFGRRISATSGGVTCVTLYLGNDIVYEADGTKVTKYIVAGGRHLAKVVTHTGVGDPPPPQEQYGTFYFHTDLVGSIRAVTNASGSVVARYDYEPFGLTARSEGALAGRDVHKFTGKPEDGGTGLYYFGARYYDPELGRFISQDPARDGLNWYVYCYDNPLRLLDPNGCEARAATLSAIWSLAFLEPSPVGELIALGLTTYVLTAQGTTAESRSAPCTLPVPVARSIPAELPPRDPHYVIGVHFTNLEGVRQIDAAGFIRPGSYFTLGEYAVGNAALDAYNLGLEYGTGKGEYFVMFRVPVESISLHESGLYALPDRTRHNLGGGLQLKNLVPVTRQDWVGGMLYLNTPFNIIKTYAMARSGRYGFQLE